MTKDEGRTYLNIYVSTLNKSLIQITNEIIFGGKQDKKYIVNQFYGEITNF